MVKKKEVIEDTNKKTYCPLDYLKSMEDLWFDGHNNEDHNKKMDLMFSSIISFFMYLTYRYDKDNYDLLMKYEGREVNAND